MPPGPADASLASAPCASGGIIRALTCAPHVHAEHMFKMVQIRNVPDAAHRTLKARTATAGQSLSDYLLGVIVVDSVCADRVVLQTPLGARVDESRSS